MSPKESSERPDNYESDFLWLEDVNGKRALEWVEARNAHALKQLRDDPRYEPLRAAAEEIYTASDRIPHGQYFGGRIHNFWQDEQHVKGIVRSTTLEKYMKAEPAWDVLLDIDRLAAEEEENWVYKGRNCLAPEYRRCLVQLSRGGADATEIREFDVEERAFVDGGFFLPEAKTRLDWLDEDHVLVATDLGEGSLTTSGYPRIIKLWKRGTSLEDAPVKLTVDVNDTLVAPNTIHRPEGTWTFLIGVPAFFRENVYYMNRKGDVEKIPFPDDVDFRGVFKGKLLALMRSDWRIDASVTLPQGSLVSIDLEASLKSGKPTNAEVIYEPTDRVAVADIAVGRDTILVSVLEDVSGALYEFNHENGQWHHRRVELPDNGSITLVTTDPHSGISMITYASFLVPDTLYLLREGEPPEAIKSLLARFDAGNFISEQRFATSADGTRVPYYVVRDRDLPMNGEAPTLVSAYGGFEVARTPEYFSALGIEWIKSGGVYVLANIRGGGEYGPRWHEAALLENRQRAYDDFIAVSEALIAEGITNPDKLGIRGGSNGGLLVMAVTAQRPDLYQAVICAVPLLDMLRYHRLSAGASWMAEYGDPDIPAHREFIGKYSPYQNIGADRQYPEVFFWTNTRDDRVHPSHARRMVAKMLSLGHDVIYFENTEGGHGGGADLPALAHTTGLELVYLKRQLMD